MPVFCLIFFLEGAAVCKTAVLGHGIVPSVGMGGGGVLGLLDAQLGHL